MNEKPEGKRPNKTQSNMVQKDFGKLVAYDWQNLRSELMNLRKKPRFGEIKGKYSALAMNTFRELVVKASEEEARHRSNELSSKSFLVHQQWLSVACSKK